MFDKCATVKKKLYKCEVCHDEWHSDFGHAIKEYAANGEDDVLSNTKDRKLSEEFLKT